MLPLFPQTTLQNVALHSIGPTVSVNGTPLSFGRIVDTILHISEKNPAHTWNGVQIELARACRYALQPSVVAPLFGHLKNAGADFSVLEPVKAFHLSTLIAIDGAPTDPMLPVAQRYKHALPLPDYAGIRAALIAKADKFPKADAPLHIEPVEKQAPVAPKQPVLAESTIDMPPALPVVRTYIAPPYLAAMRQWGAKDFAQITRHAFFYPEASVAELLQAVPEQRDVRNFAEHWKEATTAELPYGTPPYYWLSSLVVLAHDINGNGSEYTLPEQRVIIGRYLAALTGNATTALSMINAAFGYDRYTPELAKLWLLKQELCDATSRRLESLAYMSSIPPGTRMQHDSWAMSIRNMSNSISRRA